MCCMKDSPHGVLALGLLALGGGGLLLPLLPLLLLLGLGLVEEELRKGAALVNILFGLSAEELPVKDAINKNNRRTTENITYAFQRTTRSSRHWGL